MDEGHSTGGPWWEAKSSSMQCCAGTLLQVETPLLTVHLNPCKYLSRIEWCAKGGDSNCQTSCFCLLALAFLVKGIFSLCALVGAEG